MAKMVATSKMPRGVLQRYRTRMMTAEGTTFEEPSPKWARFYTQHGWASEAQDVAPAPSSPRRGRPPKSADREPELAAEPEEAPAPEAVENEDPAFDHMNVADLREAAELRGFSLEPRYYRRDELIAMLKGG